MTAVGPAWRTLSSRGVYATRWLDVRRDEVVRPDGQRDVYDHVVVPASVTVLALREAASGWDVAVTRQWIYTHRGVQWRLPAGGIGAGETPRQAAVRELREETGVVAASWRGLGRVHGADSVTNHVDWVWRATGLTQEGPPVLEGGEADLTVHWLPLTGLVSMVRRGEVLHAGSVAAVLLGALQVGDL